MEWERVLLFLERFFSLLLANLRSTKSCKITVRATCALHDFNYQRAMILLSKGNDSILTTLTFSKSLCFGFIK